jgi:flavin-dependent dehydrogenase
MGAGPVEESIVAVGGEIAMQAQHDDMVEVYVQPDLAPGWSGWTIPMDRNVSRIGIGSDERGKNTRRLLEGLMERHEHLRDSSVLRLQGGVIPVAPIRQIAEPRAMLVGDAAGQVKPTSGGGIHTSILSAKICAEVTVASLEHGQLGEAAAQRYRTEWMGTVGQELHRGMLLRHMLAQLTPGETEQLLQLFTLKEVRKVMAAQGDIDFLVHLFSHLFKPAVVLRVLRALPLRLWPKLAWLLIQWYRRVSTHQPAPQARPV